MVPVGLEPTTADKGRSIAATMGLPDPMGAGREAGPPSVLSPVGFLLLHGGFDNVAVILERPPSTSDDWKRAAAALRAGMPSFDRLRRLPAATLLPATCAIPAVLRGVRVQHDALLGGSPLRLDAPFDQWRRLVGPAVAWVAAAPGLTNATTASLHAAIRAGKILVPADPPAGWCASGVGYRTTRSCERPGTAVQRNLCSH
jgi:hypothetical protein